MYVCMLPVFLVLVCMIKVLWFFVMFSLVCYKFLIVLCTSICMSFNGFYQVYIHFFCILLCDLMLFTLLSVCVVSLCL